MHRAVGDQQKHHRERKLDLGTGKQFTKKAFLAEGEDMLSWGHACASLWLQWVVRRAGSGDGATKVQTGT